MDIVEAHDPAFQAVCRGMFKADSLLELRTRVLAQLQGEL